MRRLLLCVPACLAACLVVAQGAAAVPLVASDGAVLYKFDSASPGTVATVPVTGLQGGEILQGIDYRPQDTRLYGVGSSNRLYVIDTATGAATAVAPPGSFALNGMAFGVDFNPVVDRLRVVSDDEQNIRIHPATGLLVSTDTPLNPAGSVAAIAYANNVAGATSTTLYDIDSMSGHLVMQGGPGGSPSPNNGTLTDVGSLGLGTSLNPSIGFDIGPDGTPFANVRTSTTTKLYTVNLATGAATEVGTIGTGAVLFNGLTVSTALLSASGPSEPTLEGTGATVTVSRSGTTDSAASVGYATEPGSAAAGTDYTPDSGTLSWAAGDAGAKTFTVPVQADAVADGGETFDVTFSNPAGTSVSPARLTVAIADVPPGAPPPDTRAPALTLSASKQKLRKAVKKGVKVKSRTDEACAFKVDLKISKKLAKRLKLKTRVGGKSASLAPGTKTLRVKIKRKLRRVRKVTLRASATCADAAGNRGKATRKIKLTR